MKKIRLTRGKFALVDDRDFESLNRYTWSAYRPKNRQIWYARSSRWIGKKVVVKTMHREVLGAKRGQKTDHRDRNGLNNQRYNLRLCTTSQNAMNKKTPSHSRSGIKGVYSYMKATGKLVWLSHIRIKGILTHLGTFSTKEEAARAYDLAALKHFGEFARPNCL